MPGYWKLLKGSFGGCIDDKLASSALPPANTAVFRSDGRFHAVVSANGCTVIKFDLVSRLVVPFPPGKKAVPFFRELLTVGGRQRTDERKIEGSETAGLFGASDEPQHTHDTTVTT